MPASLYARQDRTIDCLHQNMAEDLTKLFNEGIEIEATPRHFSQNRIFGNPGFLAGWLSASIRSMVLVPSAFGWRSLALKAIGRI